MPPDQDAFVENLFHEYYQSLLSHATISLNDPSLAQDLVQDTFHALINHAEELKDHPDIKGWLFQTLINRIKRYFREQKLYSALFLSLSSDFQQEPGKPDEQLDRVGLDWSKDLETVRPNISPEDFYFFQRQVLDKASYVELSQELGVSVYALKKRRERLIRKMHKLFPEMLDKFR